MKTIRVKELIDRISENKEVPSKVKYKDFIYKKYEMDRVVDYLRIDNEEKDLITDILKERFLINVLTTELEIIEEPKQLEKITFLPYNDKDKSITILCEKLNQVIDKLNEKEGN